MKQISKDEFMRADVQRPILVEEVRIALETLEVDKALEITLEDWSLKSKPSDYVAYYGWRNKKRFTARTLTDGSGWVIMRTQ